MRKDPREILKTLQVVALFDGRQHSDDAEYIADLVGNKSVRISIFGKRFYRCRCPFAHETGQSLVIHPRGGSLALWCDHGCDPSAVANFVRLLAPDLPKAFIIRLGIRERFAAAYRVNEYPIKFDAL